MLAMRIVSLIASSTEIVCALGLRDQLVGRSHECDYPESVKELPVCTTPRFKTDGRSYMIDDRVRAIVQESLSVYRIDAELLEDLKPTHIITQSQCEVCAVSLKDVQDAACDMFSSKPEIISLEPNELKDVYTDIMKVGTACGVEAKAQELIGKIKSGIEAISSKAKDLKNKPRVALIEWVDPLMASGNWMPELVELAGGTDIFGKTGKHSSVMSWKEVADADPDVLILAPCGFAIPQTLEEMPMLMEKKDWAKLKSVKNKQVYVADGNQYFNRPGPRVLESLQIVAEILHADTFNFGLENKGWQRFSS